MEPLTELFLPASRVKRWMLWMLWTPTEDMNVAYDEHGIEGGCYQSCIYADDGSARDATSAEDDGNARNNRNAPNDGGAAKNWWYNYESLQEVQAHSGVNYRHCDKQVVAYKASKPTLNLDKG